MKISLLLSFRSLYVFLKFNRIIQHDNVFATIRNYCLIFLIICVSTNIKHYNHDSVSDGQLRLSYVNNMQEN